MLSTLVNASVEGWRHQTRAGDYYLIRAGVSLARAVNVQQIVIPTIT